MTWTAPFFLNSILLGFGLAMDAFSVSLSNGLKEPAMKPLRMMSIAGVYAAFQFAMPMIGWFCVHTIVETLRAVEPFIPWCAFFLLLYIGGKMVWEGIHGEPEEEAPVSTAALTAGTLILQGIATSIDALSVGFTIAGYPLVMALVCGLIIALVTFIVCMAGLSIGKRLGLWLAGKASILGGVILIGIGLEILITGILS